jgi:hypothetical protein
MRPLIVLSAITALCLAICPLNAQEQKTDIYNTPVKPAKKHVIDTTRFGIGTAFGGAGGCGVADAMRQRRIGQLRECLIELRLLPPPYHRLIEDYEKELRELTGAKPIKPIQEKKSGRRTKTPRRW